MTTCSLLGRLKKRRAVKYKCIDEIKKMYIYRSVAMHRLSARYGQVV
jgi:hypothetical protein